ncbi:MAG: phosphonate C-P lyase system protein PhnG [Azospirillum sp.]|nr:phosphonate C-P lyase system protein PhnG [Azospirillum sp.]
MDATRQEPPSTRTTERQAWLAELALAPASALEAAWGALADQPGWRHLRQPELGLAMVRGRAGGTGQAFNLGEMTITRTTVELAEGTIGHGHVAGRNPRHAELVALFDALLQQPARQADLVARVIAPLAAARAAAVRTEQAATEATRVTFFTMVRGE